MRHTLKIEDVDISQYGIYISSDTYLNSPQIDYTDYEVPNHNGTMIQYNQRLNNVTRKFECYIPRSIDIGSGLREIKKLLYSKPGYLKLESDYDSGFIQYGYLAQELTVKPFAKKTAKFDLYFSCQPMRFTDGNTPITQLGKFGIGSTVARFEGVLRRDNAMIQAFLNALPMNSLPDDDYFCLVRLSSVTTPYGGQSVACSADTGGGFAAIAECVPSHTYRASDFINVVNVSMEGTPSGTYTATTGKNGKPYLIFPITNKTVTGTCTDTTTTNTTLDFSTTQSDTTVAGAIGFTLNKIEMTYEDTAGTQISDYNTSVFIMEGFDNNERMFHFTLCMNFYSMPSSLRREIMTDYTTGSSEKFFDLVFEDGKVYVTKGTKKMDITSYAMIGGDISGLCNKIKIIALPNSHLPSLSEAKVYPAWWNV